MADNQLNKKELEELLRFSKLLEKNLSALDLENLNKSGNAARTLLNSLRKEAEELTRDISSAAEGFRKVVEEINNSNVGVKEVNKSFNKLTSIVDKIQYHQKGISKLNEKDVEKLQQQAKQEKERLTIAANLLKDKKAELELNAKNNADAIAANNRSIYNLENQSGKTKATYRLLRQLRDENRKITSEQEKNNKNLDKTIAAQENIQGIITDQDFHYNAMMSSLDVINKNLSDTQKLLGLGGVAIEGMNTALNKLGFGGLANQLGLDEAKEKRDAADRDQKATLANQSADIDNFINTAVRIKQTPRDIINAATGPIASRLPTTNQGVADFEALVETLGSQAFLAQIPKIKGTGNLTEKEGDKLQASLQNLSLKQSPDRLLANVDEAVRLLEKARVTITARSGLPTVPSDVPARELSVSVGGTTYNFPTKAAADAFKNSDAYRRAAGTR